MAKLRCFEPAHEALYNRGFPHLATLDEERPKAKFEISLPALHKSYHGKYGERWPRNIARSLVRAFATGDVREAMSSEEAKAAAARTDDITVGEARGLVRAMLAIEGRWQSFLHEQWLFCLEAFVGTDELLPILVDEIVALGKDRWAIPTAKKKWVGDDAIPSTLAYLSGYLMLRAKPAVAKAARAKLEPYWQKVAKASAVLDEYALRCGLDLALHGIDGARRVLTDSHWQYLFWWGFVDDAEMINARLQNNAKSEWSPDPRHAWLAGDEIFPALFAKPVIRKLGPRRAVFFERIGMFDHPAVEELMIEYQDDKQAGPTITAWLAAHGWKPAAPKTKTPPAKKPAAKKTAKKKK